VFLLTSNRLLREALSKILGSKNDLCVERAASWAPDAVDEIERSACDVLLVDPVKGESFDISLTYGVSRAAPAAKTIVINMVEDPSIFLQAVRTGVVGYLLRDASALDIVAAVRAVHQGEAVCPPGLCKVLFNYLRKSQGSFAGPSARSTPKLTRRDKQLVPMIAEGLTNKEIAMRLNLSEQTVKNHIHRIMRQTGASDRYAVVEVANDTTLPPAV
jgi:DNA-binding NarL/FixJ family response regulator